MKRIFCTVLMILLAFSAVAQKDSVEIINKNRPTRTENKKTDKSSQKGKIERQCKKRIKVNKCTDTVVNKEDYYLTLRTCASLQRSNDSFSEYDSNLKKRLNQLELDEFLNIQDTSIFGSNFYYIKESLIPARSRDFYRLVKNIHDLNCVLNRKSEGSDIDRIKNVKANLNEAFDIISDIIGTTDEKVLSWLSPSQIIFYHNLIDRYNEWNNILK